MARAVFTVSSEVDDVAEVEDLEVRAEVLEFRVEAREAVEVPARGGVVARQVAGLAEEIEEVLLARTGSPRQAATRSSPASPK